MSGVASVSALPRLPSLLSLLLSAQHQLRKRCREELCVFVLALAPFVTCAVLTAAAP
jgi:hypothetical protein